MKSRALVLALGLLALPSLGRAASLRYQANVTGDVVVIGNTLAQDCRPATPNPVVGSVGPCGPFTVDAAPDVFWVSGDPAGANADNSNTAATARSAAALGLPAGATVSYARLYWSASGPTAGADTAVTLDRIGAGGFSAPVTADATFTASTVGADPNFYYQSTADVTALVQANGPGPYRVSGVDVLSLPSLNSETVYAAWWLVVFYRTATDPPRNLAIFDGLDLIRSQADVETVTVTGFELPVGVNDAKVAAVGFLGSLQGTGDLMAFNGVTLSDALNPQNNFFNGTRSYLGAPVSNAGDQPQLTGGADSMSGVDIDVVDVSSLMNWGDTSAIVTADTRSQFYILGGIVTSIATTRPSFAGTTKSVQNLTSRPGGAVLAGDTLEYTITATNRGYDTAVNVVLNDPLPAGLSIVPGSIRVTAGANAGTKTDAAGDDQGEYLAGSRTVRVRLGTGATAVAGGTMMRNESTTVVFRAQVTGTTLGVISNQASISAAGESGAPAMDFASDGNSGAAGAQTTDVFVDGCVDNASCSGATPYCLMSASPHVCVFCVTDTHCGGTTPICNQPTHACRACAANAECPSATPVCEPGGACVQCLNSSQCSGATPVCNPTTRSCVGCLANTDCGGATPICDTASLACRGCGGDTECGGATPACQPSGRCGQCSAGNVSQCGGATPVCDVVAGTCVACVANADCGGATPVCNTATHTCRACAADGECGGATPACQASGACGQCSAGNASQCAGATPVCLTAAGTCVGCISNAQCSGTTPLCNLAGNTCRGCAADGECPAATPVCDASGACVRCLADSHCAGATPVCNTATKTCTGCLISSQCGGTAPFCDLSSLTCRACAVDGECGGATPACQPSGACGQCSAGNSVRCLGATPLCHTGTGTCVACLSNTDCGGATPVCDTTTRTCRACGGDGECGGATPACQPSGACGQCSASNASRCGGATPVCDVPAGMCVACVSNAQCSGTTPACNTATHTCRACAADGDCGGPTPACQPSGACGQCSASNVSRCSGATAVCDVGMGVCVGCRTSADCSGTTPLCDPATRACRGCTSDAVCGNGATPACQPSGACGECSGSNRARCGGLTPVCNAATGDCVRCLANADCSGTTPACNLGTHTCRACAADTDCGGTTPACQPSGACGVCSASNTTLCTGATPACNTATGTCQSCVSNGQCGGAVPICDTGTLTCRACASDGECPSANPVCQTSGACGRCSASNRTLCTGGTPVCDTATGTCVPCLTNAECSGTRPICEAAINICRVCANDGECGGAPGSCLPSGACGVPGQDGGVDAATDAGTDAGLDGGVDAATDAPEDGSADASNDASVDAGATDAAIADAGSDGITVIGNLAGGGCACNTAPTVPTPAPLLLLGLYALIRRRKG